MNKNILVVIVLAIIIIVLALLLFLPKTGQAPSQSNNTMVPVGIEVFAPKLDEVVKSPLKITGKTMGNGWIGFEAQVGTVKLLDDAGKVLAFDILTAQGEWMQQVINFETTLNFTTMADAGSLVFYNENPSGEAERNKTFSLPVKFK
ncbi:MAG: hypothetical protein EXS52_00030 [Candidatus Staskawiczbacteria bacterium]|nr:hypothetical protein [Candidatus Staskawiczbacteria bacterium]